MESWGSSCNRALVCIVVVLALLTASASGAQCEPGPTGSVGDLIALVQAKGWIANFGPLCGSLKLNRADCSFKQVSIEEAETQRGFNVSIDADNPQIFVFRLHPVVGLFFFASPEGDLQRSFTRQKGEEKYTELPISGTRKFFDAELAFWKTHIDRIREKLETELRQRR